MRENGKYIRRRKKKLLQENFIADEAGEAHQ
jgi:hypothetical protein